MRWHLAAFMTGGMNKTAPNPRTTLMSPLLFGRWPYTLSFPSAFVKFASAIVAPVTCDEFSDQEDVEELSLSYLHLLRIAC
jgi:hypothetical protein